MHGISLRLPPPPAAPGLPSRHHWTKPPHSHRLGVTHEKSGDSDAPNRGSRVTARLIPEDPDYVNYSERSFAEALRDQAV